LARRGAATLLLAALAAAAIGCGAEEGASAGATVTVYVSAPLRGAEAGAGRELCAGARQELARGGGAAGDLAVRVSCLDAGGADGRWTLARVGANARRATEDSVTVAYIGEPAPAARRQSSPIVEAAGIAELSGRGAAAMREVLAAIREGDPNEPREAVFDALNG